MKKKPTYKVPVSICAIVLVVGAIVLAILMETREMAPPRKYEVDMSEVKKKETPKEETSESEKTEEPEAPVIVPNVPEGQTEPVVKAPMPEIKKPTIDKIEN